MLNNEYFDSLNLRLIKGKFYDAAEVERILSEIHSEADSLVNENSRLSGRLEVLSANKEEITGTLQNVRDIAKRITDDANAEAQRIIAEAEARRDEILKKADLAQEEMVLKAEAGMSRLREMHMSAVDELNCSWQDFLKNLYTGESAPEEQQ